MLDAILLLADTYDPCHGYGHAGKVAKLTVSPLR